MPSKGTIYVACKFSADVIKNALQSFTEISKFDDALGNKSYLRQIKLGNATWDFDNDSQFFAEYRTNTFTYVHLLRNDRSISSSFQVEYMTYNSTVTVRLKSQEEVERVFEIFEGAVEASTIEVPQLLKPKSKIFIGHGRDLQWHLLRDHLRDQHNFDIEAYEVGSRTGHAIRDILTGMLDKSAFAILVMTGEDETADGAMRARQNVVHETGLFQGKLGFDRAILLVETGVELYNNLDGIQQIRFSKGNIREAFGDVVAVLRREVIPGSVS